jgi:hypothetical protein
VRFDHVGLGQVGPVRVFHVRLDQVGLVHVGWVCSSWVGLNQISVFCSIGSDYIELDDCLPGRTLLTPPKPTSQT